MSFVPKYALVWCEIPTTDLEKSVAFYNAVMDYNLTINNDGPNPMALLPVEDMATGTGGHIYPGKPAGDGSGPTVHLAVPDTLDATAKRWKAEGGTVLSEAITIPGGSFIYATDLDGNSIGLFKAAG